MNEKFSMSSVTFRIVLCSVFVPGRRFFVGQNQLPVAVEEQPPEPAQELMHAVDAVRIPRLVLFERAEEHLVHPQRIGPVIADDVVGVDDVVHRFRHLLDGPTANVFPVFEHEFGVGVLGHPFAERVQIEHVVAHDVDVHVDLPAYRTRLSVRGDIFIGSLIR